MPTAPVNAENMNDEERALMADIEALMADASAGDVFKNNPMP